MTAKEKAEELISKYLWPQRQFDSLAKISVAKECAIILCDEMIAECGTGYARGKFWEEVKQEITKL